MQICARCCNGLRDISCFGGGACPAAGRTPAAPAALLACLATARQAGAAGRTRLALASGRGCISASSPPPCLAPTRKGSETRRSMCLTWAALQQPAAAGAPGPRTLHGLLGYGNRLQRGRCGASGGCDGAPGAQAAVRFPLPGCLPAAPRGSPLGSAAAACRAPASAACSPRRKYVIARTHSRRPHSSRFAHLRRASSLYCRSRPALGVRSQGLPPLIIDPMS